MTKTQFKQKILRATKSWYMRVIDLEIVIDSRWLAVSYAEYCFDRRQAKFWRVVLKPIKSERYYPQSKDYNEDEYNNGGKEKLEKLCLKYQKWLTELKTEYANEPVPVKREFKQNWCSKELYGA